MFDFWYYIFYIHQHYYIYIIVERIERIENYYTIDIFASSTNLSRWYTVH